MNFLPDQRQAFRSALYLLGLGLIACAPVQSAEPETQSFQCEGGRGLHVTQTGKKATVQVGERRYELKAKASSLGDRYVSAHASLIIDGTFAAFVADDLLDLEDCRSAA
jgi:hypothetical protein